MKVILTSINKCNTFYCVKDLLCIYLLTIRVQQVVSSKIFWSCDFSIDKAIKIALESCLKMAASMLELWTPDGQRRSESPSDSDEREFKRNLEDFFETAKCTRFDDDIQVQVYSTHHGHNPTKLVLLTIDSKGSRGVIIRKLNYLIFLK